MKNLLNQINEAYPLKKVEAGDFEHFKVSMMNFNTEGYEAEGLGHVSYMDASMPLGIMKMKSLIINPTDIDMPLFSIDLIEAMGKVSVYLEQFDTMVNGKRKEEVFKQIAKNYADLSDVEYQSHWYDEMRYASSLIKKDKKNQKERFNELISEYFEAYLEQCKDAYVCDEKEKKTANERYSNGLLEHGGPATDTFLKSWGKEKTAEFFKKVLFG